MDKGGDFSNSFSGKEGENTGHRRGRGKGRRSSVASREKGKSKGIWKGAVSLSTLIEERGMATVCGGLKEGKKKGGRKVASAKKGGATRFGSLKLQSWVPRSKEEKNAARKTGKREKSDPFTLGEKRGALAEKTTTPGKKGAHNDSVMLGRKGKRGKSYLT